jgi:hypothetical protein
MSPISLARLELAAPRAIASERPAQQPAGLFTPPGRIRQSDDGMMPGTCPRDGRGCSARLPPTASWVELRYGMTEIAWIS